MGLMQTLERRRPGDFCMSHARPQWVAQDFEGWEGVTKKASGEKGVDPAGTSNAEAPS